MAQIDNASTGMASLIRNHGDINDQKIEYKEDQYDTSLGILWHIKVFVEGVELGEATRANRKTAKNVAAWEAAKLLGLAVGPGPRGICEETTDLVGELKTRFRAYRLMKQKMSQCCRRV
jgi:hypothetical protein